MSAHPEKDVRVKITLTYAAFTTSAAKVCDKNSRGAKIYESSTFITQTTTGSDKYLLVLLNCMAPFFPTLLLLLHFMASSFQVASCFFIFSFILLFQLWMKSFRCRFSIFRAFYFFKKKFYFFNLNFHNPPKKLERFKLISVGEFFLQIWPRLWSQLATGEEQTVSAHLNWSLTQFEVNMALLVPN